MANGHPEDKYGWALAGGAKFNLPGGDMIGFNVCYAEGAPGFCTNNAVFTLYNSNTSVGAGWIADGVFANGTQIELTRVWSALAGYEHIWNPKWRTSFFGGYVNVNYNDNATALIQQRLPGVAAGCGRTSDRARSEHDPAPPGQQLQPRLRLLGSRHTDAVEPGAAARYRPRSALLQAQHRLQRPRHRARVGLAAPGLRPRRPGRMVRDVPLAAQLLSMIA